MNKSAKAFFCEEIRAVFAGNNVCVTFSRIFLYPQYVGDRFYLIPTNGVPRGPPVEALESRKIGEFEFVTEFRPVLLLRSVSGGKRMGTYF